jgi:ketosteroid isomerase-like protein
MTDDSASELAELRRQLDQLTSKDAIRDVLSRYARSTDRGDLEMLKSCYWEDAFDAHGAAFAGNAAEFAEFILGPDQLGALPDVRHLITNVMIDLDGDRAFSESSFLCTLEVPLNGGGVADAQSEGRYFDVFKRRNGEWRIWRRLMQSEKMVWRVRPEQPFPSQVPGREAKRHPTDPVYLAFDFPELLPDPFRPEGNPWAGIARALEAIVARSPE